MTDRNMMEGLPGLGGGKYEEVCRKARREAKAEGVVLMVLNGKFGNGFSVQLPPDAVRRIPAALRDMANQIEASLRGIESLGNG